MVKFAVTDKTLILLALFSYFFGPGFCIFLEKMEKIKNIIFDLGGVVIDLQRECAVAALENLGIKQAGTLLGEYGQKGPFGELETGELTDAEFYDLLLPQALPGTTCTDLRNAFEAFLKELPKERLIMIRELRKSGYKLFVLSNTNPVMFNNWIDTAFRAEGLTMNDYFDGIALSFQERTLKPDPQIFRNVISRYNLVPSETLMLDDSEKNCNAAKSVGLNAIRITKSGENTFDSVCRRLLLDNPLK